jgi:4-amino-4-deoxy-L-arabinose transferase-like glycosyltransferase
MNIVNSGQWMSLTLAEENYWDKPPLQMWAIAATYKLMGISQFATRFPVAIASMLTLLVTLFVGQRLVGFRSAWLGALLLLLSTGFVSAGRYVTMDASLTAMTTAMLLFGFVATRGSFKKRYAIAAGIACGIGILVKGPVIGVICLPPLLITLWLSPSPQPRPRRWWLWFAVPALLIAAPWFIATAIIHPDFLVYFFWKHHVVRFSEAFNHREPFWYYFVGIFIFMFPASYLIPSVTKFLTSRKPENRLLRTREHGYLFLSAVWVIAFFSISESKLPTYIVPSFPPICLLMGVLLDRKLFSRDECSVAFVSQATGITKRTWLENTGRRAPVELLVWCAVTSFALLVFFKSESYSLSALDFVTGTLVLGALTVVSVVYRAKPKIAWACIGVIGLILVTLTVHRLIPAISTSRSIHLAASRIQLTEEFQNAPFVFFGRESYGASLKLDESRITWFDETQTQSMIEFLSANPVSIIVSSDDPMETLRRDLPWTIQLEKRLEARHLYVSRPNPTVIARERTLTIDR